MTPRFILILIAIGVTAGCGSEQEDPTVSDEARVLSSYLQAATCISLQASDSEKQRLVAGMPFIDSAITAATNLKDAVRVSMKAEDFLFELLAQRCPESSGNVVFWSGQLNSAMPDDKTIEVLEQHFVELTVLTVAIQRAPREDLQKYFENAYTPIGTSRSPY